jgi:hypothetical protein
LNRAIGQWLARKLLPRKPMGNILTLRNDLQSLRESPDGYIATQRAAIAAKQADFDAALAQVDPAGAP